jgi:DNA replication protein DnaC
MIKQTKIMPEPELLCKRCKGIDGCEQDNKGYLWKQGELIKCKFPLRGGYNADLMLHPKYLKFHCDNWSDIKELFKEYRNLYVWGKTGRGKTHMQYYMANYYNKKGVSVYVQLWSESIRQIKAEFDVEKTKVIVKRMMDTGILFIDDLGNEYKSKWTTQEALINILNYRYEHSSPTVITSNYTLDELFQEYSKVAGVKSAGQIVSRLKTYGKIEIKSKDWRESND